MSTVNLVKYYFFKGNVPRTSQRLQQLVALAYQTARDREVYPKAVFIRFVQPLKQSKKNDQPKGQERGS
jgi:hypothetical protein